MLLPPQVIRLRLGVKEVNKVDIVVGLIAGAAVAVLTYVVLERLFVRHENA